MLEQWYLEELISKPIRDIWKQTDYYLLKLIFNILQETGMDESLRHGTSVDQLIQEKSFDAGVHSSLKWLLDRLAEDDYVSVCGDVYKLTDKPMTYELDEVKAKAVSVAPNSVAAFNMLELMAKNYPDYLAGRKTGVDIMFSVENMEATNEYYSNNLFYNVHNVCGAKVLNFDIESRKSPKILEIGGGFGGGTKQFVKQRLSDGKAMTGFSYIFTDIANKMLRTAKRDLLTLTDDISSFTFTKLDFNKPLEPQGIAPDSLDVIWGVNAVHVASDMRCTLSELLKALKPGGSLIACETVRPIGNRMIQQEFLLNTLHDYWDVKLDPPVRPRYGFMEWTDWTTAFKAIGFSKVETVPDMSYLQTQYDNCYCAVIRGTK